MEAGLDFDSTCLFGVEVHQPSLLRFLLIICSVTASSLSLNGHRSQEQSACPVNWPLPSNTCS